MPLLSTLSTLLALASTVLSHGMITSPAPRVAGPAMGSLCGAQVQSIASSDAYGPAQLWAQNKAANTPNCNLYLCKGMQYGDSPAAQRYTPGQTVPISVTIRAPHTGTANVSIVSTRTNRLLTSPPLISWPIYASNASPIPGSQTSFSVTIPRTLPAGSCAQAGDCVLQWYWDARSVDQTYIACVDFVLGGGSGGGGAGSSSSVTAATRSSTRIRGRGDFAAATGV
ncbi:hypothetical protein MMC24_005936 [Lignoscripta atroalba]|nr:hypothetical protein [Lignoscripta atroalba]